MPSTWFFASRLLAYRPLPQVFSGLMWILFHSWPILPGLIAKAFFDHLTGAAPAGLTPPSITALVVALALARAGFVYLDTRVGAPVGFSVRALVQRNMLARVLERPGARALAGSVGEALSTFRDDTETMQGSGWLFDVVGFAVFALGGLAVLLWVNARVTLLVLLPIVAVIVVAHVARTRLRRARERSRAAGAAVAGMLGELFGGVAALQAAGAEDRVVARLRRLGDERRRAALADRLAGLVLDAAFEGTASLGAGLTLLVAASALHAGGFTVGDLALFATYLMQVAEMTGFLGWIVATYQHMGVAFARGVALLQGAPPDRLVEHHPVSLSGVPLLHTPVPSEPLELLEVRLPNASFDLRRATLTVVSGSIGAGKTTLLRAVLGLLPREGDVRWNGRPVDRLEPPLTAYTPQAPTLFSTTLRENLLLGSPDDPARLVRALRTAVLDPGAIPEGLETRVGAGGVRLSGGQLQRAAIARMLLRGAELLVVDDPSSALDVETEAALWDRLLASGATLLVVSHRPPVLARADQVLVMEDGRLVA